MSRYFLRRLLETIPTLLGIMVAIFFFIRALPGDPARLYTGPEATASEVAIIRQRFGLDRSWPEQFVRYARELSRGSLGVSFRSNLPATQVIKRHFQATLWLSLTAICLATVVGILVGVGAAANRNSLLDVGITVLAILGISIPSFFLSILLIYAFAVNAKILPVTGSLSFRGLILPTLALTMSSLATIARFARSSLLEVLGEDFIRTAKAKGLAAAVVLQKHALKNALIPVLTITGLQFGFLLSGTIIVETVFNFPGLGWLLIQSINARDYPVLQGLMLVFALEFLLINLIVDLLYGLVDPRISYD
ncbi:MAG: ABC transporter permease [Trueperaceae bacterium]|nr:MAG: ABC transporter permease [Trueperaceae bacterium]